MHTHKYAYTNILVYKIHDCASVCEEISTYEQVPQKTTQQAPSEKKSALIKSCIREELLEFPIILTGNEAIPNRQNTVLQQIVIIFF